MEMAPSSSAAGTGVGYEHVGEAGAQQTLVRDMGSWERQEPSNRHRGRGGGEQLGGTGVQQKSMPRFILTTLCWGQSCCKASPPARSLENLEKEAVICRLGVASNCQALLLTANSCKPLPATASFWLAAAPRSCADVISAAPLSARGWLPCSGTAPPSSAPRCLQSRTPHAPAHVCGTWGGGGVAAGQVYMPAKFVAQGRLLMVLAVLMALMTLGSECMFVCVAGMIVVMLLQHLQHPYRTSCTRCPTDT
eukprot:356808-Chlamydomonas_euryale.AAC.4